MTLDFTVAALTSNQEHMAETAPRCHLSAVEVGSGASLTGHGHGLSDPTQGLRAESLPYLLQLLEAPYPRPVAWHLAFLSLWPPFQWPHLLSSLPSPPV